ncbi:MAG: hypothetical protein LBG70_04635 [Bifidobacteriaceae bacterium]|nr:hypothetical protein [Bifidobacteriaceae bacterium]
MMHSSRGVRRHRSVLLALSCAALALLGGCKASIAMDLQTNDTVNLEMIMALSEQEANAMQAMGASADDVFGEMTPDQLGFGKGVQAEISDYSQDGLTGKKITAKGVDIAEMNEPAGESEMGDFTIKRDGKEYVVEGDLDTSGGEMATLGMLGSAVDFTWSITFPGKVTSHNGTLSGNTVTWAIKMGQANPIEARGSAVEGSAAAGPNVILIIGLAVVAIALIVLALVLMRRRKPTTQAAQPLADPAALGTPGAYPGAPSLPGAPEVPAAPAVPGAPAAPGAPADPSVASAPFTLGVPPAQPTAAVPPGAQFAAPGTPVATQPAPSYPSTPAGAPPAQPGLPPTQPGLPPTRYPAAQPVAPSTYPAAPSGQPPATGLGGPAAAPSSPYAPPVTPIAPPAAPSAPQPPTVGQVQPPVVTPPTTPTPPDQV